ncbi:hypothetical protein AMTRI_Chr03g43550 [Amborella trichopoda]|uniref:Protein MIZU-KUSSEI 1 n=1 Tax=Amborella trichopoda TaxID=13333 RepID=W1PVV1_AMBTC|nr:protein MIZU-KUSSEI 1 [Amborella trichopoda]ERN11425.1 hypothetical protein AMTR_s00022p00044860 [Amborella trichopoda]|eukprot:XP_011625401.1 protein MIZU-KUSSEI 1 [Amborella trichopoda]
MRMIDLGGERGAIHIIDRSTTVECGKDVRCWRSLRTIVAFIVPCCGCQSMAYTSDDTESNLGSTTGSTITGTFFGYRRGRVSFCLQDSSRGQPLLLLEFALPTSYLAREMRQGLLRITLECNKNRSCVDGSLFGVPVWSMYCNGRRTGFAVRRQATEADFAILRFMRSVSVGAGVLPSVDLKPEEGELMYLRASFERVVGSQDSESFHMIDPVGCSGQELSIFMLRS